MRRILGSLLVVALMVPALAALAQTENFRDDFGSGDYTGNDGSLDFAGPWVEIGESNGAGSGRVRVDDESCSNNDCLRIEGALAQVFGASRKADLSSFTSADLSFEMETDVPALASGSLSVQVRGNGLGWKELGPFNINSSDEYEEVFDVSAYAGSDFELRFRLSTSLLGGLLGLLSPPEVSIDRVLIEGPLAPPPPTTTTTTTTSTTSTTAPTTTSTTRPIVTTTTSGSPTTTSGSGTTSSTSGGATTSTTAPGAGTEPGGGSGPGAVGTTTTTSTPVTTRGGPDGSSGGGPTGGGGPTAGGPTDGEATEVSGGAPAPDPELRVPAVGLIAGFTPGLMGDMETGEVEVLGLSLEADFSLAVEAFEAARVWVAALSLLIAAAVVSGMDRRRHLPTR